MLSFHQPNLFNPSVLRSFFVWETPLAFCFRCRKEGTWTDLLIKNMFAPCNLQLMKQQHNGSTNLQRPRNLVVFHWWRCRCKLCIIRRHQSCNALLLPGFEKGNPSALLEKIIYSLTAATTTTTSTITITITSAITITTTITITIVIVIALVLLFLFLDH